MKLVCVTLAAKRSYLILLQGLDLKPQSYVSCPSRDTKASVMLKTLTSVKQYSHVTCLIL